MTATNPKVALFWASLATYVGSATTSGPLLVLFAGVSALLTGQSYGGCALIFSAGGTRRIYRRFSRGA